MTTTRTPPLTSSRKAGRLSILALALSLSTGTIAGLVGIASFATAPAMAQGNGGNGGGGGAAGAGGEGGSPMAAARPFAVNQQQPNNPRPNRVRGTRAQVTNPCGGAADSIDTTACKFTQHSTPRIVTMQGFERCGLVQRVPGVNGGPAEFYCLQPL
jgi:hypothetical protein